MAKAHKRPRPSRKPPGWRVKDPIPVGPIRDEYLRRKEAGELTPYEVATNAGVGRTKNGRWQPDTSWVERRLGLRSESRQRKNGKMYQARPHDLINHDIAVRIVRAMGMAPVDIRDEDGEALL